MVVSSNLLWLRSRSRILCIFRNSTGFLVWLHFTFIALRKTTKIVILLNLCTVQVWVSHVTDNKECGLTYCDTVWSGRNLPTFARNVLTHYSNCMPKHTHLLYCHLNHVCIILCNCNVMHLCRFVTSWHIPLKNPPEKLVVAQEVLKFPDFFGVWMFIPMSTRVCHWSLSWIFTLVIYRWPMLKHLLALAKWQVSKLRLLVSTCLYVSVYQHICIE
jgi:hypothetical protein